MPKKEENIPTRIWQDVPEDENPFATKTAYCYGYDVYGELLKQASWIEYLYLLFVGESPNKAQTRLLEGLAIILANPGPRDHSVRAAMNGGAGGSSNAACLMAALGVGAGNLGGAHEVFIAIKIWQDCGQDINKWKYTFTQLPADDREDVWSTMEHVAGFDPNGTNCPTPVLQSLNYLKKINCGSSLTWLSDHRIELESSIHYPLSMSGVAAAALFDLGLNEEQAEMLYLFLRLPGAAVHAIERKQYGWRQYPFFADKLKFRDIK